MNACGTAVASGGSDDRVRLGEIERNIVKAPHNEQCTNQWLHDLKLILYHNVYSATEHKHNHHTSQSNTTYESVSLFTFTNVHVLPELQLPSLCEEVLCEILHYIVRLILQNLFLHELNENVEVGIALQVLADVFERFLVVLITQTIAWRY